MNKSYIFIAGSLIFLGLLNTVNGQNWHPIVEGDTVFYQSANEIRSYCIDSVTLKNDSKTCYSFNEVFAFEYADCFSPFGSSWMGKKFVVTTDSTLIFNYYNQAITLLHHPEPGQTWTLFNDNQGTHITARAISYAYVDAPVNDSVLTLVLETDTDLNGAELKISKSKGLIQTFNFLFFPDMASLFQDLKVYNYTGSTSAMGSRASLSADEIYNFEIGDEFHSHRYSAVYPEGTVFENWKIIRKVTAKTFNANHSELTYTFARCDKNGESTETISYSIEQDALNHLPYEPELAFFGESNYESVLNTNLQGYFFDTLRYKNYGGQYIYRSDSCFEFVFVDKKKTLQAEAFPFVMQQGMYVEGCGGPYYDKSLMFSANFNRLVYFKKGDLEWGTPFDCDDLVGIASASAVPDIEIYPNPVDETLHVEFSRLNQATEIRIYNALGALCGQYQLSELQTTISLQTLGSGIYYYTLWQKNAPVYQGKLIKQ